MHASLVPVEAMHSSFYLSKMHLIVEFSLTATRALFNCRDAEAAAACHTGVRLAVRWPDRTVTLESDCSTVIARRVQLGAETGH